MKPHPIFQAIFGLVLLAFVGMGVFGWEPPAVLPAAEPLWDGIYGSGYLIPVILLVYLVSGLTFLTNRFVALGSIVLLPVSLNILLFHTILNPRPPSVGIASALFLANAWMLYHSRAAYRDLLAPKL